MPYTTLSLAAYQNIVKAMNFIASGVLQIVDVDGHDRYRLGHETDQAAGLHGFVASPPFRTLAELDAYCLTNLSQYDLAATDMERANMNAATWFQNYDAEHDYMTEEEVAHHMKCFGLNPAGDGIPGWNRGKVQ